VQGLTHRRVVNTRATHQAVALDVLVRDYGADPVAYPCIDIIPVEDDAFDSALRELGEGHFDWLVLTSPNAVMAVARRLEALHLGLGRATFRTAAIGPSTHDLAGETLGINAIALPGEYVAEALGASLPVREHERVLLPESEIARPVLANMLRERGATVTVVTAYRTVMGRGGMDVPGLIAADKIDAITFTSPSTVTNFVERMRREGGSVARALGVCAACIGPVTAEAAHDNGFTNVLVASEYTLAGLMEKMNQFFCDQVAREDRS
jgi:uroporphyrinogen-III synthase